MAPGKHCSVLNIINRLAAYADRSKPGAWADMDMLEVGNGGMTDDEVNHHLLDTHFYLSFKLIKLLVQSPFHYVGDS